MLEDATVRAMGAKDEDTLKAFLEAVAYDGPALIIAYSHCIAHGINMIVLRDEQVAFEVHSHSAVLGHSKATRIPKPHVVAGVRV